MKKKTTIGGVPPKPAKNTTGATNRTSGYLNPNAAGNKKVAPKKSTIKITGSAKAAPVEVKKTFKPGSMITSSKLVPSKPQPTAKKKPMSAALKSKVEGAMKEFSYARGNLYLYQEAKKLGNLKGPGVAAKRLKEANQRVLDRGRTASRAANILSKAKKK